MNPEHITSAEAKARGFATETVARLKVMESAREEGGVLIREIELAFADVPRPRITQSVARGYDDEWNLSDERVSELAAQNPEQVWKQVSDESMESCQEYFTFSDAEGWQFYLPAYMCHYLRNFPGCGWDAVYWACVRADHFDLLNRGQMQCVNRFLELCHKYEVNL